MSTPVARKPKKSPGVRPGKKEGVYRIEYYDWDGTRRTKVFHGSHSDAFKLRRSLLVKVDRIKNGFEQPANKTNLKFCELWERFQRDYQMKVNSGSIEQSSLDRYVISMNALRNDNPTLENKLLSKLKAEDFEQFKIYRHTKGYSPDGINTNIRNLRTIFNYALSHELIHKSPLKDVPYIKISRRDVRYLDEEDIKSLSEALKSCELNNPFQKDAHDLVLFYLFTGARAKEILYPNLNWSCIGKNNVLFPKTKMSETRNIPLTRSVYDIVESRRDIYGGPFFSLSDQKVNSLNELEKHHMSYDMVYKRTKSIFNKASLQDVSIHTLRKTAGAYYYIATRDIFATSRFLGHSSVKVTESHYVGLIQSLEKENSKMFESVLINNLNS